MSDRFTKEYWPSEQDPELGNVRGTPPIPTRIDPLAVIPSAVMYGQISQVHWALVERGDGLVLAIGDLNIPLDTKFEVLAARAFASRLKDYLHHRISHPGRPKPPGGW